MSKNLAGTWASIWSFLIPAIIISSVITYKWVSWCLGNLGYLFQVYMQLLPGWEANQAWLRPMLLPPTLYTFTFLPKPPLPSWPQPRWTRKRIWWIRSHAHRRTRQLYSEAFLPAGTPKPLTSCSQTLTPMGEHFSTNFRSWDLAVPGSPNISKLMSPRRVSPSGSLEMTGR